MTPTPAMSGDDSYGAPSSGVPSSDGPVNDGSVSNEPANADSGEDETGNADSGNVETVGDDPAKNDPVADSSDGDEGRTGSNSGVTGDPQPADASDDTAAGLSESTDSEDEQAKKARLERALRRYRATLRNEAETVNEGFSAEHYRSQKPPHW